MAKFNKTTRTGATSPVKTTGKQILNSDGFLGFERDAKSELFLLAVSNFVGINTFYESATDRDNRFARLSGQVAVADEAWFRQFIGWLRNEGQMRSAALVAAAEGAKALLDAGSMNGTARSLVAASMARADEPGEFLAYWTQKYGKNLPQSVKKGVGDAAKRLYNEYSLLKYDTESKGFRFADVLQLTHAKANAVKQNDLFQYALDRRYNASPASPSSLTMVENRASLMATPVDKRRKMLTPELLKGAGMTWESVAGWIQGPMDKDAWEAIIPSMGYMALLRNLRNFMDAKVSAKVMKDVLARISDAEQVAKSRQFPFRFLSAYNANKGNLKIASALEDALNYSLANVPELPGKTLILVDRSGSMFWSTDQSSGLQLSDQAAIFGTALALRAENANLVEFGSGSREIAFRKSDSVLPMMSKFTDMGGTSTNAAIQKNFNGHDRVIVITDEQYNSGAAPSVKENTWFYTWNLGGYRAAQTMSGQQRRHTFGGLTDKAFQMIPLIEAGASQSWPWLAK